MTGSGNTSKLPAGLIADDTAPYLPKEGGGRVQHDTITGPAAELDSGVDESQVLAPVSAPTAVAPPAPRSAKVQAPLLSFSPADRAKKPGTPIEFGVLNIHGRVSGMVAGVDASDRDVTFDPAAFEHEPIAMRSVSCVAVSTKLDDVTVSRIISGGGTTSFKKISSDANGSSIWIYSCHGERTPVPASMIYDEIDKASRLKQLPIPSVMRVLYQGQHDASTVLDTFQKDVGDFSILTMGKSLSIGDEAFVRAIAHPRVQVYLDAKVSRKGVSQYRGRNFYAMDIQPSIHTIHAGGSNQEFGREKEAQQMERWVDETFRTGVYSSMTIHGDAMMGKTRRAQETLRYVKEKYPDAVVVFAPAMDTYKSSPFHFVKTFASRLVEGFSSHATISKTKIYQDLSAVVRGETPNVSVDYISSLLVSFFQLLPSSSAKLFLINDDLQWPDTESNFFLAKVFTRHETFGNTAVLNLTRTGDEVMSPDLLRAMRSKTSDEMTLKPLPFLDKHGEPTPLLRDFVCGLLHVPDFDVPSANDYLKRMGKIAQGNGGVLTELVRSMQQAGVIAAPLGQLDIDHSRFMTWDQAGEAENVVVAKVDRLLRNSNYRDVLLHFVAFRESGACGDDFFVKFLKNVLKRPDLVEAYRQLVSQQVISIQELGDQGDGTLSFSQDLVGARLRKEFSSSTLYVDAHKRVARFMFDMDMMANNGVNSHLGPILERCSPRAIFTHAHKGGMLKLAEGYAIPALREAYQVGDHSATLEIYQSIIESNPVLMKEIATDDELQLNVLHSMTVLRKDWSDKAIAIADVLKEKYLAMLTASTNYDPVLVSRIERLYDLMCTFYFLRATVRKLRDESIAKMKEWAKGFEARFFEHADGDVKLREGLFMNLKAAFYQMLIEYLKERYVQACDMYRTSFQDCCLKDLYRNFPDAKNDPRCQKLELEAMRVSANAYFQGFNRASNEGLEGSVLGYADEEACIASSRDPASSMRQLLLGASEFFSSYLRQVAEHPDQVMDRTQVYRAKQGYARVLGMLGKYGQSFEMFLDARSDASRYGDPERFADITDSISSMLGNMGKHFLSDPSDQNIANAIQEVAALIRRSEQGDSPDQQDVFASLLYILKKAYQYSQQAAQINTGLNHASYLDTATINMILVIETMVSAFVTFKRSMDPDTLILLEENLGKILINPSSSETLDEKSATFFNRMTQLDRNGNSGEYWNYFVGPCLARLALASAEFEGTEVQEVFKLLLTELGDCMDVRANLLHSLQALTDERFNPRKARVKSYDAVIDSKRSDVESAMTFLEQGGHMRYSIMKF